MGGSAFIVLAYAIYIYDGRPSAFFPSIACALFGLLWLCVGISEFFNTTYRLVFDMGGVKTIAYDGKQQIAEAYKNDIILGIQRGYFPNYLQSGQ